jgi:hypothetical protein
MVPDAASSTRVLVVEDTQAFVDLVVLSLAAGGYAIEVARGGRSGLERARSFRPDIVIVIAASFQWVLVGPDASSTLGSVILFADTVGDALLIALVVPGLVDGAPSPRLLRT